LYVLIPIALFVVLRAMLPSPWIAAVFAVSASLRASKAARSPRTTTLR
jgi:hypothetical protein